MNQQNTVQVWDIPVRLFHWSLLLFFIVAYATSEDGGEIHEIAGYIVLGLVCFRILWGFIGSPHARFTDFIYSPRHVIEYLKSIRTGNPSRYLGHNPLGGYMVIALLVMLLAVTLTGLKLEDIKEEQSASVQGQVTALVGEVTGKRPESEEEKRWEEIHEAATNIMLGLIALHVLGVISSSRHHKENLVVAMFTGKKQV